MKQERKEMLIGGLIIGGAILLIIVLIGLLNADTERQIKKVSSECAVEGKGIEAHYGNDGEKFYSCSK